MIRPLNYFIFAINYRLQYYSLEYSIHSHILCNKNISKIANYIHEKVTRYGPLVLRVEQQKFKLIKSSYTRTEEF